MRLLGPVLVLSGIFLAGLSGLEKVLIYSAVGQNQGKLALEQIIFLAPTYMWKITQLSFWFGVLFFVVGGVIVFSYSLRRPSPPSF